MLAAAQIFEWNELFRPDRIRKQEGVTDVMAALGDLVELEGGEMAYIAGWPADSSYWRTLDVMTSGISRCPSPSGAWTV